MGFPPKIKEDALVSSGRCCCVCNEFKGVKVEVHHIVPREQGGADDFANAIPLCFDCHADAGHYHAQHPKGSKYSPSELRKHRDSWYEKIREGKNTLYQSTNGNIICQYIVTSNTQAANDIMNNQIELGYFTNILCYQPDCIKEELNYFLSGRINEICKSEYFDSEEEYLLAYPNAKKNINIDTNYLYERIFELEEVEAYNNLGYTTLLKNGCKLNEIVNRNCYYEGCGGQYVETVTVTELSVCFLSMYNATEEFVCFDEIEYKCTSGEDVNVLRLPKFMVQPKATVLIPISIFAEPIDSIVYENLNQEHEPISDYEVQEFNRVRVRKLTTSKDVVKIGNSIIPLNIKYTFKNRSYFNAIHPLDLNNMYKLDRYFCVGSCPHVFAQDSQQNIVYLGELFCKNYGANSTETLQIPINSRQIIITELEYETTFIKSISIDNQKIINYEVVLNKNEYIEFDAAGGTTLFVEGYYLSAVNPEFAQIETDKNKFIKHFVHHYKYLNHLQLTTYSQHELK